MPAVSKGSPEAESHFSRPEIIRPPSEWRSYYLPLTSGCANSTCTFCNYYGTRLKVREAEDVRREIDALALYMRSGIRLPNMPPVVYALARQWDGRRVFLQDGDALVYPYPRLLEVLAYLNERFPALERVACYATPQDILRRSPEELEALRKLKLGILYTGLESGSDEVLAAVGKGVTSREMVAAGRRVKDAGIVFSVSVILGLGGPAQSREHALATAQVLSEIDPEYVGALTLTLIPGTPLYDRWREGDFELLSPFAFLEELKLIVENARFSSCFFSSMHASNYLAIRGRLPQDRDRMLAEIEDVLRAKDASRLRPEYLRGL